MTSFLPCRSNYPSPCSLLCQSLFLVLVFASLSFCDGPRPGFAGGQAGGRGRLCESEWRYGVVLMKVVGSCGCSITASPEWGSRYKAPIALRSLSLLCGRPPQSCPLPRQLWASSKSDSNFRYFIKITVRAAFVRKSSEKRLENSGLPLTWETLQEVLF